MAKIGAGHVGAMARLGLAELRNAANPSRESVADKDIGLYGSATPGQVDQERSEPNGTPEKATMSMDDVRAAAQEKAKEKEQGKDGPDHDHGREM